MGDATNADWVAPTIGFPHSAVPASTLDARVKELEGLLREALDTITPAIAAGTKHTIERIGDAWSDDGFEEYLVVAGWASDLEETAVKIRAALAEKEPANG